MTTVDGHDAVSPTGKYAMFSGGYDSLVATWLAMERGAADTVLHIDTGTGIPENQEWVVEVCEEFGWPLRIERSSYSLEEVAKKYGFPGTSAHQWIYAYLKERCLRNVADLHDDLEARDGWAYPRFYTGVRESESEQRLENFAGEVQEGERWTWYAPIYDMDKPDVDEFIEEHGLPRNPVADKIHRSGECYCGAYANRDEELLILEAEYEHHYEWLMEVEERVQAYRGRLKIFEDRWPEAWERLNEIREWGRTVPYRLDLIEWLFPARHRALMDVEEGKARQRGQQEKENYWGHDKMPSRELQALVAEADPRQMTLCAGCFKGEGTEDADEDEESED